MKAGTGVRRAERCAALEHEKAKDEIVRTCRVFKQTLETARREYLFTLAWFWESLISMLSYWFPNVLQELGQEW